MLTKSRHWSVWLKVSRKATDLAMESTAIMQERAAVEHLDESL